MALRKKSSSRRRIGVWVVGINGGLATTLVAGTRMIAAGLASQNGLLTATDPFNALDFAELPELIFGGHDIRPAGLYESAYEIHHENGSIPLEALQRIRPELDEIDKNVRVGSVLNCGRAIEAMGSKASHRRRCSLRETVRVLRDDMREFGERHELDDVIVVNLASTEPPLELTQDHRTLTGLERIIRQGRRDEVRASTLYAYAALKCGFPFLNFTPSNACVLPGHVKLAEKIGVPIMGNDGKTGETLVKSALAPMFKYRNFRVLSWQGYNILGDRDGMILADKENKESKISTKDGLLSNILGYPLHTHVAIDYVPSLADLKTAWDFIHFQGFLDYKMSMQFTWHGCDAILAAPVVLDMIRLAEFAHRQGEAGLMHHLSCFFKAPLGVEEHDLHNQFHSLLDYVAGHSPKQKGAKKK